MSIEAGRIQAGQRVVATDAFGRCLDRVAITGPQRGDDFPVIWVCRPDEWVRAHQEDRSPEGVPWPMEDVAAARGDSA